MSTTRSFGRPIDGVDFWNNNVYRQKRGKAKGVPVPKQLSTKIRDAVRSQLACTIEPLVLDQVFNSAVTLAAASGGTNTGTIFSLMNQSVVLAGRKGDVVKPLKIYIGGTIVAPLTGTQDQNVRLLVYQHHQLPAGANNNSSGLLEVPLTSGLISPRDWVAMRESTVIYDHTFHLTTNNVTNVAFTQTNSVPDVGMYHRFSQWLKPTSKCPRYSVNTALEDHYYFVIMCDDNTTTAGAHVVPAFSLFTRFIYSNA